MRSYADLRPYQTAGIGFANTRPRCYIAAKAGAGKTAMALSCMATALFDTFTARKVLVVGPKRVAQQWPTEASGWAFGACIRWSVYLGDPKAREEALAASYDAMAVSFDFFPELVTAFPLAKWPFDLIIFDEASRLRSGGRKGSVGWKAMNAIARKTDSRIIMLSGSPRPGTAHELFAPAYLMDGGERLGTTLFQFRSAYLEPNKTNRHTGQVYSWKCRQGMEQALYDRLADVYFAVAPDLGLKSVVIDRWVGLPAKVEQQCRQLQRDQVVDLDELELIAGSQGTVAGKLHQMCQGAVFGPGKEVIQLHDAKLDDLAELIDSLDGDPVIVAYWYEHDKARLLERFPSAVDITTEQGLADAKAGRVQIGLLHPASAGHGIDGLQKQFSALAWFCVPMSFELYDQTNKRIVRSGMVGDTARIYRILASNGIVDARAIERLAEKEAQQDAFFKHLEGKQ